MFISICKQDVLKSCEHTKVKDLLKLDFGGDRNYGSDFIFFCMCLNKWLSVCTQEILVWEHVLMIPEVKDRFYGGEGESWPLDCANTQDFFVYRMLIY